MSNTIPYIGSKISLISNSEIRYEGILYTINTQESTIALQSVKTFGTEGRKMPEIPPSSEIYDFIIFRGQDIKDLTVLEGAQNNPMVSDPAIMSMNQRPATGGPGKDGHKGGGKSDGAKGSSKGYDKGDGGRGWGQKGDGGKAWGGGGNAWGTGGKGDGWGKGGGWGKDGGKGRGDSYSGGRGDSYSGGGGYSMGGKGKDYYSMDKGKGGKSGKGKDYYAAADKGKGGKGKGKGESSKGGYGRDAGKGEKGGKGNNRGKGSNRTPGMTAAGVPVGELLPEVNADAKKEFAEDFDVTASNTKFDKVTETEEKKPLSGYNKSSSFFDNISCEATDRAADTDRQKIDREKARQFDKETFGDTRRPPRPVGVRRGKGKGSGKAS